LELLERDSFLEALRIAFDNMTNGNGSFILISGEAGIGKTSLVAKFSEEIENEANIYWGACDALFTPRPLGPLYDIAPQVGNELLDLLDKQSSRTAIFSKFLENLQQKTLRNIIIIEDAHWADESTLDLIKFLGRRANRTRSLFIITYRNDEIDVAHPLRLVLGDIPSKDLIKLTLPPLTQKTVNNLAAESGITNLYEITYGNPFLISELLSNKNEQIPSTIKDSILTRISRLSAEARELTELVAVIPTRSEKWLIKEIMPAYLNALDECIGSGILKMGDASISFRHELSRMAAEELLSQAKKELLNEEVLKVLLNQERIENYLARIIHHAARADKNEIIIKYAADAAKQASLLGAHSLAAEHYRNALRCVDNLPIEKQIDLYEGMSYESYLTGKVEEGINAGEIVLGLLKKLPLRDLAREGENYRRMSRMFWYNCNDKKGEEYLDKAIEILEKVPASKKLAMAYSNKSQTYMTREDSNLAIKWGEKALELAQQISDVEVEAHALNNIGCAMVYRDNMSGLDYLKKSLQISFDNNFYEHAGRAYTNLGSMYLILRKLEEAERILLEALEYCNEKDLYTLSLCSIGHFALGELYLGQWDQAVEKAYMVTKNGNVPPGNKINPIMVIGLVRARRDDPGALNLINEAYSLSSGLGEMEKIVVVNAAKAEIFWLQDKLKDVIDEIKIVFNKINKDGNSWEIGQLAYWLWKGNELDEVPGRIAEPYLAQIKGDWKTAAKLWDGLNCPYEQALALSEGDKEGMKTAINIFEQLGASAASKRIKQFMKEMGMSGIPKGPRKTTRENLAGLTSRQIEVLSLLNKGLSNFEIGNKLYISPKTVEHHISAILAKLNIHSRHEAAAYARSKGIAQK
jgi:DNA-binding CsgD family transcriptional regulator